MCYWPTIYNLISKICPKFQILSSHFFWVNELLNEHWANIFQLQSMSSVMRCINQRFAFNSSRILCLALIFNLNDPKTTVAKYGEWYTFSSSNWYEPMAKCLPWVRESRATWVRFLMSAETLCCASAILRGTERLWARALSRALFILLRSLNFFFLGFCQCRSRADRVVNLYTTIWLPLVWRTWTWARASTRPHVQAWHTGRDYSDCTARLSSELTDRQVSGFVYSWFLENTEKTMAS